jgi:ABC-type uncharacterized transport system substrate-binding protein
MAAVAEAHPHVFADVSLKVVYDKAGFCGIKNHWVYDEVYSAAMAASADQDNNGKFSASENSKLEKDILGPIAKSNYYNYVQAGSVFLKVKRIKNFKASLEKGKLVLDFETEFSQPAESDWTMLVVVVADPSNYIQMTSDMENADVESPDNLEVEYFSDALEGLSLFKAFRSEIEGLYLRYKKK